MVNSQLTNLFVITLFPLFVQQSIWASSGHTGHSLPCKFRWTLIKHRMCVRKHSHRPMCWFLQRNRLHSACTNPDGKFKEQKVHGTKVIHSSLFIHLDSFLSCLRRGKERERTEGKMGLPHSVCLPLSV